MEFIETIYSADLIPMPFSNIKIAINLQEVTFTLVTNKKYKRKSKVSFFPSMFSFNSKSKMLLKLWAFSLFKAITTYSVSKLAISCSSSTVTSSSAIIISKTIKP